MAVDFVARAREVHGERYDYSRVVYRGMNQTVEIGCPKHGWFTQKAVVHIHHKSGCPVCKGGIRLNRDQIIDSFVAVHGNRYGYEEVVYTNKDTKVRIRCPEHGVFLQTPHMHKRGQGCPKCNGGISIDGPTFIARARSVHGDTYNYDKVVYRSSQTPVTIVCSTHGEFDQLPNAHIGPNKSGCPSCGSLRRASSKRRDPSAMIEKLRQRQPSYRYDKTIYDGYHGTVTITCERHGDYQKTFWNALHQGCPKCASEEFAKSSRAENVIRQFISSFYQGSMKANERFQKNGSTDGREIWEVDIWLPDLKIAIEYCGLRWHSEGFAGKGRTYHYDKHLFFEQQGIRLITIFEDEWVYKRSIVEQRLVNLLGATNTKPLNARTGTVKDIDKNICDEFLERHHIQGPGSASVRLGLFITDSLVAVMKFARPSVSKGKHSTESLYELTRFSTAGNVRGAAGKLFAEFLRSRKPASVFSFSDVRWNTGKVYEKIGMSKTGRTPPNYWYIDRQKRIHRFGLRKNPNDDADLTEWENRQLQGWDRIWDCGSDRFEWGAAGS